MYLNWTQVFRENLMSYFSPQPHVQMRENPFNTVTLKTVALLLVGEDHMLPIVKNILQMIQLTRIFSTGIFIWDIINCSNCKEKKTHDYQPNNS